jgi:hypothetical protein
MLQAVANLVEQGVERSRVRPERQDAQMVNCERRRRSDHPLDEAVPRKLAECEILEVPRRHGDRGGPLGDRHSVRCVALKDIEALEPGE